MNNVSNTIDINEEKQKRVGRPALTEAEKEAKAKQKEAEKEANKEARQRIKNELNIIKKAIIPLVEAGFQRKDILNLMLKDRDELSAYSEKIDSYIKQIINMNTALKGEIKFKDIKYNAKNEPVGFKSTLDNFKAILDYMHIEYKYNVISADIEIYENGVLSQEKSSYKGRIYSIAQKRNCDIRPQDIGMFVNTIAIENKYNPWKDYVEECIEKHADTGTTQTIEEVFNTLTIRNHYDRDFAYNLFQKFLMHFIASFKIDNYGCNGVFILQGPQNIGKTSFFENLVPKGFFKEGMSVNPDSDDAVRKVLKYMLVELGEIEGTLKADVNKLKNFITEKTFAFRKQYSDYIEENKRYTVLCGTCNSEEFLKDDTGDRRYWVIPIGNIDHEAFNNIDIDKLWAEVYYLFNRQENTIPLVRGVRRNHAHELTRDESKKLIDINKEDFTFKTTQQIKIEDAFDWNSETRYYISTATLSLEVFKESILPPKIASVLKSLGLEKEKKRLYGKNTWYFITPPLRDKELMQHLNLISVEADSKKKELIKKLGTEVESWK